MSAACRIPGVVLHLISRGDNREVVVLGEDDFEWLGAVSGALRFTVALS